LYKFLNGLWLVALGFEIGNQLKLTFFSIADHQRKNTSPRGIGQAGRLLCLAILSAVEAIDIAVSVEFGKRTRLDKVARFRLGKFRVPFSQVIDHGLNGAFDSEWFGRDVGAVMPRFLQRLRVTRAEKLCKNLVGVLTPGFEEMYAPNHSTHCTQCKVRV